MKHSPFGLFCAGLFLLVSAVAYFAPVHADLAGSLKSMAAGTQPVLTKPDAPRPIMPLAVYLYYGDTDIPFVRTVVYDNGLVVTADPPVDGTTFADVAAYQDAPDVIEPFIRYDSVKLDPDELDDLKKGLRLDALMKLGDSYEASDRTHYRVLIWRDGQVKTILAGGYLYAGDGELDDLTKEDIGFPANAADFMERERRALPYDLLHAIDTLQNAATSYSKPIPPVAWELRITRAKTEGVKPTADAKPWPPSLPQIDTQTLTASDAPQFASIDQTVAQAVRDQERKDKSTLYRVGDATYQVLAVNVYAPLLDHEMWDSIAATPVK